MKHFFVNHFCHDQCYWIYTNPNLHQQVLAAVIQKKDHITQPECTHTSFGVSWPGGLVHWTQVLKNVGLNPSLVGRGACVLKQDT